MGIFFHVEKDTIGKVDSFFYLKIGVEIRYVFHKNAPFFFYSYDSTGEGIMQDKIFPYIALLFQIWYNMKWREKK
jgi:hypothetical protein